MGGAVGGNCDFTGIEKPGSFRNSDFDLITDIEILSSSSMNMGPHLQWVQPRHSFVAISRNCLSVEVITSLFHQEVVRFLLPILVVADDCQVTSLIRGARMITFSAHS